MESLVHVACISQCVGYAPVHLSSSKSNKSTVQLVGSMYEMRGSVVSMPGVGLTTWLGDDKRLA